MSTGQNQYGRATQQQHHVAIQDLTRRLHNLVRVGTIHEVDSTKGRCRVNVGGNISGWQKWHAGRSGDDQTWNPPSPGEQITLLCPSGRMENATVLHGLYDKDGDSPDNDINHRHTSMKDGTQHFHDVDQKVRQMSMPNDGKNTSYISDSTVHHDQNGHALVAGSNAIALISKDKIHLHHGGAGVEINNGKIYIRGEVYMPDPKPISGQDQKPTDPTPQNAIPQGANTSQSPQPGMSGGMGGGASGAS